MPETLEQLLAKRRKLPKELAELQEKLSIPGQGPYVQPNPDAPPVEVPPQFRKPTKVIGADPYEASVIEKLLNFLPQLRGRVPSITSGYGPSYLDRLTGQATAKGNNPQSVIDRMNATFWLGNIQPMTLAGTTSIPTAAIEINTSPEYFEDTLLHELSHAARSGKGKSKIELKEYLDEELQAQRDEETFTKHKKALRNR